jgi:hypothetical protein
MISYQTNCEQDANVNQIFTTSCNAPTPDEVGVDYVFAENKGCKKCTEVIAALNTNRTNLEGLYMSLRKTNKVPNGSSDGFTTAAQEIMNKPNAQSFDSSFCEFVCEACIFTDISQSTSVNFSSSCRQKINVEADIKNKMQAAIAQQLNNKEDFLGRLGGFLSGGSSDCISSDVFNRINNKIDETYITELMQDIELHQQLTFSGTSLYVSKFDQSVSANTIAGLIARSNLVNKLYNDDEVKDTQNEMTKNDTVGDISKAVSDTIVGLAKLWSGFVGRILLIIGLFLGIVIVIVIGISITKPELLPLKQKS